MVTRSWVLGAFLIPGFLVSGCSTDDSSGDSSGGESKRLAERVRAAVDRALGTDLATAYSVAVWRDGEVIYAEAFGEKDPEGTPATTDTLFQIGSDTKKMTAMALLQKVDQGMLDLDDTVAEQLPELVLASDPAYFENVTIRDLLRQTTGLFDYPPFVEDPADSALRDRALGRFAENEYSLMPPSIAWQYSNPNYAIAGLIDETLDGRPWADIMAEDVIAPLGLSHTYPRRDDMLAVESDMASGHGSTVPFDYFDPFEAPEPELGWVAPEEQLDCAFTRPAGLVWSTPTDQVKLLAFFIDGAPEVLSDELRLEMMSEAATLYNHSRGVGYGYGLLVQSVYPSSFGDFYETPFVWHDGATLSMSSLSFILPEQRVAVSVLANGAGEDTSKVAQVAAEAAAGDRLTGAKLSVDIVGRPSTDLESYAGTYSDRNLGEVTITWEDNHLAVSMPVLEELGAHIGELEPVGNDLFLLDVDGEPVDISFYDAPDGTPHAYGVNRQFVLTKEP
jgi:CubicO group peptidase (beta-lactamase class C family)